MIVTANFICQFNYSTVCSDIWSNIILGVCEVFWMRLTWESAGWADHIAFPNAGGSHSISWRPGQSRKAEPPTRRRELLLSECLSWGMEGFFSLQTPNETKALPKSPTFGLKLYQQLSWLPDFWTQVRIALLALLGLQLAKCKSLDLSNSSIAWTNSWVHVCVCVRAHACVCVCVCVCLNHTPGSISLENPNSLIRSFNAL